MASLHSASSDAVFDNKYRPLDKWGALCPLFILIILFLVWFVKYYFKESLFFRESLKVQLR